MKAKSSIFMDLPSSFLSVWSFLLITSLMQISRTPAERTKADECRHCQYMVRTFLEGLNKTENLHFGGGNTDWEERNLGKFKTSESRLVESMEYVCRKDSSVEFEKDSVKDLQFNCHRLAEDSEEWLENWYFNHQDEKPDLEAALCVDELKRCCPSAHYGQKCSACPGLVKQADNKSSPCFGRGTCAGDGTRGGDGKCECDRGYVGKMCSNCDAHYFPTAQNATYIECEECFDGCASGCTSAGPKGCKACRTGYRMDEEAGCQDIDECLESEQAPEGSDAKKCTKDNEVCVNTAGLFRCDCASGYIRRGKNAGQEGVHEDGECELDIEDRSKPGLIPPDTALRLTAIVGLFGVSSFVLLGHRTPASVALTIVAVIAAFVVDNHFESLVPESAKEFLRHSLP